ncbi:MAG: hypothetical protein AMXMBFR61_14540 [Fimbriimonadales bacterium]
MKALTKYTITASLALACATVVASAQQSLEPQGGDLPKSPLLASRVSELPPPLVVYPGETIVLRTDRPHDPGFYGWVPMDPPKTGDPDVQWIEYGEWKEGYWRAFGGTLVSADERTVVFQAPIEAGLAFLEWSDGGHEPICLAFVVPGSDIEWDTEVELPTEQLDGLDGSYLPSAGGSSFRVFAVHPCGTDLQNDRPCGEGFAYAENLRLVPGKRPNPGCQAGERTSVHNSKEFSLPPTSEYAGKVSIRGVEVVVNRIKILSHRLELWDCYECRDGVWKWCGNRAKDWWRVYITYSPEIARSVACAIFRDCGWTDYGFQDRASGCCKGWTQRVPR